MKLLSSKTINPLFKIFALLLLILLPLVGFATGKNYQEKIANKEIKRLLKTKPQLFGAAFHVIVNKMYNNFRNILCY